MFIDDPEALTPEERFEAIAAILATGFLRLLATQRPSTPRAGPFGDIPIPDAPQPPLSPLDLPAETSVHAERRVNRKRPSGKGKRA